ncbi:hypothetical protein NPX13_g5738 [Xylaria arbuscula]|uniref:Uncharacterized protein n=1 Tax=Xylaria arbuscula TaxID=114810 RepID=A0A9W8TKR6_9PEZI|nr:hypothetical protein NPX13_g5738 [Xylaria arbuscula]
MKHGGYSRTVGKQSIGVGVVKGLGRAERGSGGVAVSQVVSASNASQVGDLVEGGSGLFTSLESVIAE